MQVKMAESNKYGNLYSSTWLHGNRCLSMVKIGSALYSVLIAPLKLSLEWFLNPFRVRVRILPTLDTSPVQTCPISQSPSSIGHVSHISSIGHVSHISISLLHWTRVPYLPSISLLHWITHTATPTGEHWRNQRGTSQSTEILQCSRKGSGILNGIYTCI